MPFEKMPSAIPPPPAASSLSLFARRPSPSRPPIAHRLPFDLIRRWMLLLPLLLFLIGNSSNNCLAAYFSQFSSMRQPDRDPCYDTAGRPVRCVPDFINAAFGKPVIASSTCGSGGKPSRFCLMDESVDGMMRERCEQCDAARPELAHPAQLLTDLNNPNNLTCWVSEPSTMLPNNVTLTLSLGKKFEITYVSLHFCGRLPDSLAIYKSNNRGRTWIPMQFYSSECDKVYRRPKDAQIERHNEQDARCTDAHALSPLSNRIAFATLEGRPSALDFEQSPTLQDWVTATDIRVVFNRLSADQAELYGLAEEQNRRRKRLRRANNIGGEVRNDSFTSQLSMELANDGGRSDEFDGGDSISSSEEADDDDGTTTSTMTTTISGMGQQSSSSLDQISARYFYAMAELAVGGRCKCNGHASRCVIDRMGRYACDCKHATTGLDCEKCRPFHFDRPWARASAENANPCVACNCNLHSRKCRFNAELYRLSGYQSGGVCLNCRHNTAGRNCHYCKLGYYRDQSKPITHRKACKPCLCHPIGSLSRNCNQTSGQCICKPGVEGPTCNRCAKGFQQSRSPVTPCIRPPPPANALQKAVGQAQKEECEKCRTTPARLTHKRYCRRDYAIQVQITGRELINGWAKFHARLLSVPKDVNNDGQEGKEQQHGNNNAGTQSSSPLSGLEHGTPMALWLPNRMLICKCPRVKVGRKYLLLGRHGAALPDAIDATSNGNGDSEGKAGKQRKNNKKKTTESAAEKTTTSLALDRHSLMLEWNDEVAEQIARFKRTNYRERCNKMQMDGQRADGGGSAAVGDGGGQ